MKSSKESFFESPIAEKKPLIKLFSIRYYTFEGLKWVEIDNHEDLKLAEALWA